MKIERLPSGSYRVRKQINGKRITFIFDHKPSNREVIQRMNESMEDECPSGSFGYFAEKYIEDRSNVLSPASIRTYINLVKVLSKDFKNKKMSEMRQEDVQKEINRYSEDHAPKTVRSLHGFLASVFASYRPSFVLSTTLPQKEVKRPYRPNKEDIKRILNYEAGGEYEIAFKLGCLGLRRGEICCISAKDLDENNLRITKTKVYDGKNWIIKKNPKTDESNRIIPISDELAAQIREIGIVFGRSPKLLNTELHRACKALDIPAFRFHDLRHYFATMASLLAPEQDVMSLGGWRSDFVFKRIYRETISDSVKQSAKKIIKNIF